MCGGLPLWTLGLEHACVVALIVLRHEYRRLFLGQCWFVLLFATVDHLNFLSQFLEVQKTVGKVGNLINFLTFAAVSVRCYTILLQRVLLVWPHSRHEIPLGHQTILLPICLLLQN